jgi:hypothetical protein
MALKHILGTVPVIRILDFLLDHRNTDYTKAEIAKNAGVGPTDMRKDFHCLLDCEMVVETRKIGGVQLYKLSEDDITIDAVLNLVATIGHVSAEIDEGDTKVVSETRDEDGSLLSAEIEMTVPNGFGNLDG